MDAIPRISVVVTVGLLRDRAELCVEKILAQQPPPFEVLVMDLAPEAAVCDRWTRDPAVRYVPMPGARSILQAKADAPLIASGDYVAYLEDHCHPRPGWLAGVIRGFEAGADVVGYGFHNMNPVNATSRAFFTIAYGPWAAPAAPRWVPMPSYMNVAYRAVILRSQPDLEHWLVIEHLLYSKLAREGKRFWHAADANVEHLNHPRFLGCARDSAVWQRLAGAARVRLEGWGWPRRIVYACGSPLVPLLNAWRLWGRLKNRPELHSDFRQSLPLVLTMYFYGAFAEALGYLFGPGASARDSIHVETADPRQ